MPRLLANQLRRAVEQLSRLSARPDVVADATLGEAAMDAQVKTPSYKARLAELRWLSLQVRLLASGRRWPGLMAEIAVLLWHLGLAAPQNERGRLLAFGSHGYEQRLEALLGSRTLIEDMNSWRAVARTLQKLEQLTQETLHVVQRVVNDVAASFGLPVSHIDERHLEFTVNSHRLTVKIKERGEGPNTATVDVLDDTVIITTVPRRGPARSCRGRRVGHRDRG